MPLADFRDYYADRKRQGRTHKQALADWKRLRTPAAQAQAVNDIHVAHRAALLHALAPPGPTFLQQYKQLLCKQQYQTQRSLETQAQLFHHQMSDRYGDFDMDGQFFVDLGAPASSPCPGDQRSHTPKPDKKLDQDRQRHLRRDSQAGFKQWMGSWPVGEGRSATAIWVRLDGNAKVSDRVLVKDTYVNRHDWMNGNKWAGDLRSVKRKPMEFAIQQRLTKSPEHRKYFAGVRKCKVVQKKKMYRLHLDYCTFGDGSSLIKPYRRRNSCIPEPMLWYIFEMLTEAALIMEQGSLRNREEGWLEVVHRDVKPDDILFDDRSRDPRYPAYPTPVLADFGEAIQTSDEDPWNPTAYQEEAGEKTFTAPELKEYYDARTSQLLDGDKVLAPTNVWSIGATMLAFMDHSLGDAYKCYFLDPENREPKLRWEEAQDNYSDQLQKLVAKCTRFKPSDRPTLPELLRSITDALDENKDPPLADGMRHQHHDLKPDDRRFVNLIGDEYAVGLAKDELPAVPVL